MHFFTLTYFHLIIHLTLLTSIVFVLVCNFTRSVCKTIGFLLPIHTVAYKFILIQFSKLSKHLHFTMSYSHI